MTSLPLRLVPTLRRGVQVLIDRADPMAPFQNDVDGLTSDLQPLFSVAEFELLEFRHCPGRGVRAGGAPRAAYLLRLAARR